jgi:small subunit ribosomal protein S2
MFELDLKEMLDAGVHFGHQTMRWNPKMAPYIFGARNGVHIINLDTTLKALTRSMEYIKHRVSQGEKVLFVGTKRQCQEIVLEEAKRSKTFYVVRRWLGGTLTNFRTIRTSVDRLKQLEKIRDDNQQIGLTKKEILQMDREITKLKPTCNNVCH